MIITQTFTLARWQIAVKKPQATKQIKDQNNNKNKQTNKTGGGGPGGGVGKKANN